MTNRQRILQYLQKNLPYSYNAKTLYRVFKGKMDYGTIKTELSRLVKDKKILRETRGFYIAKVAPETLRFLEHPPTLLHGIMLECKRLQKGGQGIPPQSYTKDELAWFFANNFTYQENNYSYHGELWIEDRRTTITFHQNGKICIHINSTKHPINYLDFCNILNFLNGFLHRWTPFDKKEVRLKEVGIGKDYKQLRLDGVTCISLHKFTNAWSRIYYKDDIEATRFEHHINCEMTLDDAIRSFQLLDGTPTPNGIKPDERRDVA